MTSRSSIRWSPRSPTGASTRCSRAAPCTASRSPTTSPPAGTSRGSTSSSTPPRTSARPASCATRARSAHEIVTTTQQVVDACVEHGAALAAFSSAEVYGRSGLLRESDDIVVPTHYNVRLEYAIAKTLTEAITINSRHRGLRGLVIRPFNVGGPRQSRAGGFVMPTFVQQAIAGRPLTVFASGDQVRAFLSATDLARFVSEHLGNAFESERPIFNLGNPANAITVMKLAERIVERLGSSSTIEHVDARTIHGPLYEEAESFEKLPVLDAAAKAGWAPAIGLDELIDETALYYRVRDDARDADAAPLDAGARV